MFGGYQGPGQPGMYFGHPHHQVENRTSKPPPLYMLVMGPQGCGKSSFVNTAIGRPDCTTSADSKLCTRSFYFCKWSRPMNGCEFRFTDTPGFGNDIIDDRKIFELLIENLVPKSYGDHSSSLFQARKVTGLLYFHSEDEPFRSRTSQKTIEMLANILGEQFLDRVTVLIRSQNTSQNTLHNFMPHEDSPLYPLYCKNTKPWTVIYGGDFQSIEHILGPYTGLHPRVVRFAVLDYLFQRYGSNWRHYDIPHYLREFYPEDIGPQANMVRLDLQLCRQELESELDRLKTLLTQKEEEAKSVQADRLREKFNHEVGLKRLQNTVQDQEVEISKLKSIKDLEMEKLEMSKNEEISLLGIQKDSEIRELRESLRMKDEELEKLKELKQDISKLTLEKESEIEVLRNEVQAKDDMLIRFKSDSERRIQQLANAAKPGTQIGGPEAEADSGATKTDNRQEGEIDRLSTEIRRISAEYASLRNHMQLEENTEQADITIALGDINRLIEEFGGSLSEHIEKHMEQNPPEVALQPQDLMGLFGQVGSETALKVKQDAYVLFEYAVQATLCNQLYTHLFKPFHPRIADDEKRNMFIIQLYEQLAYKEPQSISGRWRKDAFNSISSFPLFGGQDKPDDKRMHRLITEALSALLGKLVNIQPNDVLKEHERELIKLITKAEELNRLLKGGVSILGDFLPIAFPFDEAFRPDQMSEITSRPKKVKTPENILATIELGLVKKYALGGGRKPEETVLRRAIVFGSPK